MSDRNFFLKCVSKVGTKKFQRLSESGLGLISKNSRGVICTPKGGIGLISMITR